VNFTDCTAVVETGTPASYDTTTSLTESSTSEEGETTDGGQTGSGTATDGSTQPADSTAASTKTAAYRIRWHDVAHLVTTRLQSNIKFSYTGTRVTSSSDSWSDYYLYATGWRRFNGGPKAIIYRPNNWVHRVVTDGDYRNRVFCDVVDVTTYHEDIRVYGYGSGAIDGNVQDTWTVESPAANAWSCPNLHWHANLISPA
jgi:hypothetical protein